MALAIRAPAVNSAAAAPAEAIDDRAGEDRGNQRAERHGGGHEAAHQRRHRVVVREQRFGDRDHALVVAEQESGNRRDTGEEVDHGAGL